MLWVWLHENCEVWLDEAAVILRFALCECGSIHPQCEVDVSLQGSAGMPRGMTKRRSSSSPHQNQSIKQMSFAGGMMAEVEEIIHVYL